MDEFDHQLSHSGAFIGSNDGLLTEILLWLPVISILRFKCVSRHLRSLLSHTSFTIRYDTKHFHKSPGIFSPFNQYVPFDDEAPTNPPFRNLEFFSGHRSMNILQTCNGLLLCYRGALGDSYDGEYYVFNPTTKQFVIIPSVPGGIAVCETIRFMGLAYHQTDCVHFKVVCILMLKGKLIQGDELFQIQTYSSETRKWKVSIESFFALRPNFGTGVYWNGALHWTLIDRSYMYFKLDVEELHSLHLPEEAMASNTMMRYLGESRGHLHLIVYDRYVPNLIPLKVYEMSMDRSGWFVKYNVELDQLKELRGAFQMIFKTLVVTVVDVIRGEKYDDTVVVLQIYGLYVTYNVHDKSFKWILKLNNVYKGVSTKFRRYSQTLASI